MDKDTMDKDTKIHMCTISRAQGYQIKYLKNNHDVSK